jgi:hypothetical protein
VHYEAHGKMTEIHRCAEGLYEIMHLSLYFKDPIKYRLKIYFCGFTYRLTSIIKEKLPSFLPLNAKVSILINLKR